MNTLEVTAFSEFFEAVNGVAPFPWQRMLAERVAAEGWPDAIDLPTASGKTACMEVAVFVLAMQSARSLHERTARRRLFFVVDRRIVVDEAYERAKRLSAKLAHAQHGILREVADRLRQLAGGDAPLVVSRLRGGTVRDDAWRASPAQPAIITGTVDQIGSRLLFHSYGASDRTAPIDAALVACDSLVLLDEAHCAVPFMQTANAVRQYASAPWAEGQVAPPLSFTILSATPPEHAGSVFPSARERTAALDHDELRARTQKSKRAELVQVRSAEPDVGIDPLVSEAVDRAAAMVVAGRTRIAVMVNRVATAAAIESGLSKRYADHGADVVLLTGRMRPVDRDIVVRRWSGALKAGSAVVLQRPVIVVTTQCLEVGADFSFDGLVTECASLDALRQRFGRLDRLGRFPSVSAAILVRADQVAKDANDPIYGSALAQTWHWLMADAAVTGTGRKQVRSVDLGIDTVASMLPAEPAMTQQLLASLSAPALDAPVLLPAHIDLFAQTAPRPLPSPDPAVFLHGAGSDSREAYVIWRADLVPGHEDDWIEALTLVPPTTAEALAVPLPRLRRWLFGNALQPDATGDVEGELADADAESERAPSSRTTSRLKPTQFVRWRGRERSEFTDRVRNVQPGDIIVLAADEAFARRLGASFQRPYDGDEPVSLDAAERACLAARGTAVLRVMPALLASWKDAPPVRQLLEWADSVEPDEGLLTELLRAVGDYAVNADAEVRLPEWLGEAANMLAPRAARKSAQRHPINGFVLTGRTSSALQKDDAYFADDDDARSEAEVAIGLNDHLEAVAAVARQFATLCVDGSLVDDIAVAAAMHDLGKLDARFQAILLGSPLAVASSNVPVAKSPRMLMSLSQRRRLRAVAGLPDGFRHELLSAQLAAGLDELVHVEDERRELVLHLIASHHGHARPFAPVCEDDRAPAVTGIAGPFTVDLDAAVRSGAVPAHRLDSGIAERFWSLVRRYGWWGLAYLETMVRLADWSASSAPPVVASREVAA